MIFSAELPRKPFPAVFFKFHFDFETFSEEIGNCMILRAELSRKSFPIVASGKISSRIFGRECP